MTQKLPFTPYYKWVKFDPIESWTLPSLPCCYVFYLDGIPSYVGQSNNLKRRILNHFLEPMRYSARIETPWGNFREVFIKCKFPKKYGEWAMLELRLIRKLRPKFNKVNL